MCMMSNQLCNIWDTLKQEKSLGLVKRLYSSDMPFHIYATFQYPENYYGVAFTFNKKIKIDITPFDNLRELRVLLIDDATFPDSQLLLIQLLHPASYDIFASLCENLIQVISCLDTEDKAVRAIINQLEKWKTLFDKNNSIGLTPAEQQGLFGELHFLEKVLNSTLTSNSAILHAWVGTDRALRDFQASDWAVEIKTTATNNPQKITINGERQLDETFVQELFLFHLSVEISKGIGNTLFDKVLKIRSIVHDDIPSLSLFNLKLFEVGYLDKHAQIYKSRFYSIRSENYYKISNDFPRIKENELRNGISDVKYSIILSMCDEYLLPENHVLRKIFKE